MKATGNGTPKQCVENLLSIIRGECPMDRVKGIDSRIFDKPRDIAAEELKEDVAWNVKTFEPRVNIEDLKIEIEEQKEGGYKLNAYISDT